MQTKKDMMLTVLTVGFLPHQDGPPKCIWSGVALIKPNCPANSDDSRNVISSSGIATWLHFETQIRGAENSGPTYQKCPVVLAVLWLWFFRSWYIFVLSRGALGRSFCFRAGQDKNIDRWRGGARDDSFWGGAGRGVAGVAICGVGRHRPLVKSSCSVIFSEQGKTIMNQFNRVSVFMRKVCKMFC